MLATENDRPVGTYKASRHLKPYETDQIQVSASAGSSPMLCVIFSSRTPIATLESTLTTTLTVQLTAPGSILTNLNHASSNHPPENRNQGGNCRYPASGPATSSAPSFVTRSWLSTSAPSTTSGSSTSLRRDLILRTLIRLPTQGSLYPSTSQVDWECLPAASDSPWPSSASSA